MTKINPDSVINKIDLLPPLPQAIQKLIELSSNIESNIRDIEKVISQDQALTAKILKLVNSAFYGFSQKIATVTHAIVILGFKNVRSMALGMSLINSNRKLGALSVISPKEFWQHSLATGLASRLLSKKLRIGDPEELFVAGLLHDIGRLIFMEYFSEPYNKLIVEAKSGEKKLIDLEDGSFGINHAELGFMISKKWRFPSLLQNCVRYHHLVIDDSIKEANQVYVVKVANNLVKFAQLGASGDTKIEENILSESGANKINSTDLNQIIMTLNEDISTIQHYFEL